MSFRNPLPITGGIALAVILVAAAAVIDKPGGPPEAVQVEPPPYASPVEVDERPTADPDARGVIAGLAQGQMLRLTPQGEALGGPEPFFRRDGLSRDGRWLAMSDCKESGCSLVLGLYTESWGPNEATLPLQARFLTGEWAPQASVFAALDSEGRLYLVEPETRAARVLQSGVTAFAWAEGDRLILAAAREGHTSLLRMQTTGAWAELGRVKAPVNQFFPSPDALEFAFAQDDAAGWRLLSVNAADGRLRDFGNLGGDSSHAKAPAFAIAWSPDRNHLAVGPVIEPFALHVVSAATGGAMVSSFRLAKGYAGELKWSPDGSLLAISTYAPNRVWHEVFVLGMDNLDAGPRFLLDGCEIVWSPDGLFVAVKREASRAQAMAAIRVDTGDYWHVSNLPYLVPAAWGFDAQAAAGQAMQPQRRSGQLGK
jgi:hypothetical protein